MKLVIKDIGLVPNPKASLDGEVSGSSNAALGCSEANKSKRVRPFLRVLVKPGVSLFGVSSSFVFDFTAFSVNIISRKNNRALFKYIIKGKRTTAIIANIVLKFFS